MLMPNGREEENAGANLESSVCKRPWEGIG